MRFAYGSSQGSFVAVGYSPCRTILPRSSTSVLRPFSVSSLAAHPPLMPVPTTIASNEFVSMPYRNPRRHVSISNSFGSADYGLLARHQGSDSPDHPAPGRHRRARRHLSRLGIAQHPRGPDRRHRSAVPAILDLQLL